MPVVIANLSPVVVLPAKLYLPGGVGLPFHEHDYEVHARRVAPEEFKELQAQVAQGKLTETELCDRVVVGWAGMLDGDGQPVPYSHQERKDTNAVFRGLEQSMACAFFDGFDTHQRVAAEKNSEARSAIDSALTAQTGTSSTPN